MLKNNKNTAIRVSDLKLNYVKGHNPNEINSIIEEIDQVNIKPSETAIINKEKLSDKKLNEIPHIKGDVISILI